MLLLQACTAEVSAHSLSKMSFFPDLKLLCVKRTHVQLDSRVLLR
jgi:hypothetical protein